MTPAFTTRPEIRGRFGMATSTHWIASAVGFGILEKGGNAFDAAVAAGFVLQIVEPHLNGPAGDLPAIVHSVQTGETQVVCAQGCRAGRGDDRRVSTARPFPCARFGALSDSCARCL
jgi:gamma-glutamyltranspeptidase